MDKQDRIIDFIKKNSNVIANEMGFLKISPFHNGWINKAVFSTTDFKIYAHRGSYKTTAVDIVGIALRMILYPQMNGRFFRKTDDKVKEVIRGIKQALNTDISRWIAQNIWDTDLMITVDNATELQTNLYNKKGGAIQLVGNGFKTAITGAHADYIFTDDICDLSDRLYEAEREKTKTMYQELRNIINRDPWCFIGNTGTSWHKDDIEKLLPVGEKVSCYNSGLMTPAQIDEMKRSMVPSLFAANYELKHIASDQQIFNEPVMLADNLGIFDGVAHLDCAYGGDDTTALTILKKKGDEYVGFGKCYRRSIMLATPEIVEILRKYRVGKIYMEDNADKGYVARDFREYGFEVSTYHEKQNKDAKITTHGLLAWKKTKWIPETDLEYLEQCVEYQSTAELVDCPDSLASLGRQLTQNRVYIGY